MPDECRGAKKEFAAADRPTEDNHARTYGLQPTHAMQLGWIRQSGIFPRIQSGLSFYAGRSASLGTGRHCRRRYPLTANHASKAAMNCKKQKSRLDGGPILFL